MSLRQAIKQHAPWLVSGYSYVCWNLIIRPRWRRLGMEGVFTEHYRRNCWGNPESPSGDGATLEQTQAIRQALPDLVRSYGIHSLLDIPCGDFNWMKLLDLPVEYVGADIVPELVAANQQCFGSHSRRFVKCNLTSDPLPCVDLILCRDCLVHLSLRDVRHALANIKRSGSRFLLTTTHNQVHTNNDIVTGEWRRLNLEAAPFFLPPPSLLIDEKCSNPYAPDKYIGFWQIDEIPLHRML